MATKTKNKADDSKVTMGHLHEIPRLKRIKGQVDGIERMIGEKRYCVEILQQIKAAKSAMQALENSILKTHLEGCVREAFESKDVINAGKKIAEISELLNR